ncbi:MAG: hypothetical protein RLP44_09405 [Aggregatilineales bacterium]
MILNRISKGKQFRFVFASLLILFLVFIVVLLIVRHMATVSGSQEWEQTNHSTISNILLATYPLSNSDISALEFSAGIRPIIEDVEHELSYNFCVKVGYVSNRRIEQVTSGTAELPTQSSSTQTQSASLEFWLNIQNEFEAKSHGFWEYVQIEIDGQPIYEFYRHHANMLSATSSLEEAYYRCYQLDLDIGNHMAELIFFDEADNYGSSTWDFTIVD